MGIFNGALSYIDARFKIPAPKRFKTKITPIYEINIYEDYKDFFTVSKHELKWVDFDGYTYLFWFIPFVSLFQHYKYVEVATYEFDTKLEEDTDIGALWEEKFAEKDLKQQIKETEEERLIARVNTLNKTFKDNYEK